MKIAVAIVAALALALGAAGTVYGFTEAGKVAAQARQLHRDEALLRSVSQRETDLAGQMSTLNAPSDPLSAYSAVCNQQMTNQSSGVTQTYWFPCTNNAQTIPQPAG